jgi:hypothetical protein
MVEKTVFYIMAMEQTWEEYIADDDEVNLRSTSGLRYGTLIPCTLL